MALVQWRIPRPFRAKLRSQVRLLLVGGGLVLSGVRTLLSNTVFEGSCPGTAVGGDQFVPRASAEEDAVTCRVTRMSGSHIWEGNPWCRARSSGRRRWTDAPIDSELKLTPLTTDRLEIRKVLVEWRGTRCRPTRETKARRHAAEIGDATHGRRAHRAILRMMCAAHARKVVTNLFSGFVNDVVRPLDLAHAA
jgi:hypothetical protein